MKKTKCEICEINIKRPDYIKENEIRYRVCRYCEVNIITVMNMVIANQSTQTKLSEKEIMTNLFNFLFKENERNL